MIYSAASLWFCLLVADFETIKHAVQNTVNVIFSWTAIDILGVCEQCGIQCYDEGAIYLSELIYYRKSRHHQYGMLEPYKFTQEQR